MGQNRTYRQYTEKYKEEAVALVRKQDFSVPEAAKSLGIASNMLYRWKDHCTGRWISFQTSSAMADDFRALNVVDDFSREMVGQLVCVAISGAQVA